MSLVVVLAACDGSATVESTSQAAAPTAVSAGPTLAVARLTDDGCTADAPQPIDAGVSTFTVHNDTSSLASFQLIHLLRTYDEFTEVWAQTRERDAAGEEFDFDAELAPYIEERQRIQVGPGASGEIVDDVTAGAYAMWCITLDEHEDVVNAWTAGPFTVTES